MARNPFTARILSCLRLACSARVSAGRDTSAATASALSRRQALALAAAGLAASCAPPSRPSSGGNERIAVIGAGMAGLTLAYRLMLAGRGCTLFDSANRTGGRMFTRRNFTAEGQFCELGGEFVDTGHTALIALAGELGVAIQPLDPDGEHIHDVFHIAAEVRTSLDLFNPATGTGAFLPIAARLVQDQDGLLDADDNWTDKARALDAMSLRDWLDSLSGQAEAWALSALDVAYTIEYGIATADQSALNLVDFMSPDTGEGVGLFGESDEAWRIAGGSSSLPEAVAKALGDRVPVRLGQALSAIAREPGGAFRLTFISGQATLEESFDRVVLTLPFTRLRQVAGLDTLGLTAEKARAIAELGYGNSAKIMHATPSRLWRAPGSGVPPTFSGAAYSDQDWQCVWETSRAQAGTGGILTNFLGAAQAGRSETEVLETLYRELPTALPALGTPLQREGVASFFWGRHPHTLASYAGALKGQYTGLLEHAAPPECEGRLHFAGEHTSADFIGYMNGAVDSAERVAGEILASL